MRLEGLDNHGMGTVFESSSAASMRRTTRRPGALHPRDVVQLMARLVFLPVADEIRSGTYLVYDGACGTGGMLTVAEEALTQLAGEQGKEVSIHLYGQEVNPETYAISKADLILKGRGRGGRQHTVWAPHSLLTHSQPASSTSCSPIRPYGKSWKTDPRAHGRQVRP